MDAAPKVPPKPNEADQRIAPDPVAVVLPAVAALGAIASIAAIHWVAQEKSAERARPKRRADNALRDLESCCLGLQEIFRRFHRHPKLFAGDGGTAASPMKFGVVGTRVGTDVVRQYQQLVNDAASMLVIASQNSYEVMAAVEDGEINAPEEVFFGFGEQQERLNALFQSRAPLKSVVDTGYSVACELTRLIARLKTFRVAG